MSMKQTLATLKINNEINLVGALIRVFFGKILKKKVLYGIFYVEHKKFKENTI